MQIKEEETNPITERDVQQYLTFMIEGIIILLVSTDVITLRLLKGGRQLRVALKRRPSDKAGASPGGVS